MSNAKEVVLAFVKSINEEDFKTARVHASDDMSFVGVLGSRDGADAYFRDMENMKLKYDIKKVFVDEDDVCLFYDLDMHGEIIFGCGWYHVKDGQIDSLRVVFDPRAVLQTTE